jgi:hypothetical protein
MLNLLDHAEAATTVNAFVHPQPAAHGSPLTLLSGRPAAAACDGIERLNSRHAV